VSGRVSGLLLRVTRCSDLAPPGSRRRARAGLPRLWDLGSLTATPAFAPAQKLLGQAFELGYNAMYDRVENLLDSGVIDPAKVRWAAARARLCPAAARARLCPRPACSAHAARGPAPPADAPPAAHRHRPPPPPQVTRNGIQNACSIAGIMLTTQAVMVEKEPNRENLGYGAGGMPSGMTV
jgi:hypothetical protein